MAILFGLYFARLVRFVGELCSHVIWLEDDALLPPRWFDHVKNVTRIQDNWIIDLISGHCSAGVLLNSKHIPSLVQYLTHHFDDAPLGLVA